jgi:hypothetical protein
MMRGEGGEVSDFKSWFYTISRGQAVYRPEPIQEIEETDAR